MPHCRQPVEGLNSTFIGFISVHLGTPRLRCRKAEHENSVGIGYVGIFEVDYPSSILICPSFIIIRISWTVPFAVRSSLVLYNFQLLF